LNLTFLCLQKENLALRSIPGVQGRPQSLAFEHSDLLAESQDFQGSVGPGPEQSAHGGQ
jgi:hypothetical protein